MNATATAIISWALWKEPEDDHAVAVSDHCDTPDKIDDLRESGQPRLNGKLKPQR